MGEGRDRALMEQRRMKAAELFARGKGPNDGGVGSRRTCGGSAGARSAEYGGLFLPTVGRHLVRIVQTAPGPEPLRSAGAAGPKHKLSEAKREELAAP